MQNKNQFTIKRTIFSVAVIFCSSFSLSLSAQGNVQVLDETAMRTIMDANKQSGKPTCQGIYSKLVVTTSDVKVSSVDSTQIIKNILKISDVLSCVYHPSKHSLVVKTNKQENVFKIINIKEVLAPFNVYIANNEETIYTEKK